MQEGSKKEKTNVIDMINMMKTNEYGQDVQEKGCKEIVGIVNAKENRAQLMKIACVEVILKALNIHKQNANIQKYGCAVVGSLLEQEENISKLSSLGISDILLLSMNDNKENEEIQENICHCWKSLSNDQKSKAKMMKIGVYLNIADAMKTFKMNAKILQKTQPHNHKMSKKDYLFPSQADLLIFLHPISNLVTNAQALFCVDLSPSDCSMISI